MRGAAAGSHAVDPANPRVRKILDAASGLFMRAGYGATSMDAIAGAAGVSKVTVYSHFASKERLFAAIVDRESRRVVARMSFPDVADLPVRDGLIRIGTTFLDLLMTPRVLAIFRVVIAEIARFPELGQVFYRAGPDVSVTHIAGYLADASARGVIEVRDPRLAAGHFLGMLRGDTHLRGLLGLDTPATAVRARAVEQAVDAFLRAYAPRATRD